MEPNPDDHDRHELKAKIARLFEIFRNFTVPPKEPRSPTSPRSMSDISEYGEELSSPSTSASQSDTYSSSSTHSSPRSESASPAPSDASEPNIWSHLESPISIGKRAIKPMKKSAHNHNRRHTSTIDLTQSDDDTREIDVSLDHNVASNRNIKAHSTTTSRAASARGNMTTGRVQEKIKPNVRVVSEFLPDEARADDAQRDNNLEKIPSHIKFPHASNYQLDTFPVHIGHPEPHKLHLSFIDTEGKRWEMRFADAFNWNSKSEVKILNRWRKKQFIRYLRDQSGFVYEYKKHWLREFRKYTPDAKADDSMISKAAPQTGIDAPSPKRLFPQASNQGVDLTPPVNGHRDDTKLRLTFVDSQGEKYKFASKYRNVGSLTLRSRLYRRREPEGNDCLRRVLYSKKSP